MKILYVDLKYDYGKKEWGINYIGQDGFLKNFKKLGHEIEKFYYDNYLEDIENLQNDLIQRVEMTKPDLIFFSLYTDQFKYNTLDFLKSKYRTICWFGDDTWKFDDFTSRYASHFTYCITTDKYSIRKYFNVGQNNVILSQWAAIDNHEIPKHDGIYKYDVSFVGLKSDYREWFIKELVRRGIKIEVFGNGWPKGIISEKEMNGIFTKSKINLNISNSTSYDIRCILNKKASIMGNIKLSIKTLLYLMNNFIPFNIGKSKYSLIGQGFKNKGQIKARNFEIPYFGGFQLAEYVMSLEDYFAIGSEISCYRDIDEAETLIKYYLGNADIRENIRINGHKRAVAEHGYYNRIKNILEQIK